MGDIETSLAPISQAQRMLTEATNLAEFREVRDYAEGLRAWARARGEGVTTENLAAAYILRAERAMGQELIRMAEVGERAARGQWQERKAGPAGNQVSRWEGQEVTATKVLPSLTDLGVSEKESYLWQRLAKRWTDEEFESHLSDVQELGARVAKVDFYRGPKSDIKRQRQAQRDITEEQRAADQTTPLIAFERAVTRLIEVMPFMPADDLRLASSYAESAYDAIEKALVGR